jgi:hypothetical protein
MLIELTEDTLQDLIAKKKSSGSIFGIMVWQLPYYETKIQKN